VSGADTKLWFRSVGTAGFTVDVQALLLRASKPRHRSLLSEYCQAFHVLLCSDPSIGLSLFLSLW
jgi:hypothetical protein